MTSLESVSPFRGSDASLAKSLGLRPLPLSMCSDFHLGTVRPFKSPERATITTIDVYVTAMPAQFWRFDIVRLCEDGDYREELRLSTGSGRLSQYWPVALLFAEHMIDVKGPVVLGDLALGR
jgi:hypothetical protein